MKAQTFQDLMVWQKAHQFVLAVYRLSQSFPSHEIYGLTSQIRRASVSIPANIAEGFKKKTPKEKVRFFNIAQGSLEEVRYYLILTRDLNYGDTEKLAHDLDEIGRMLEGYMKSILRKRD
jgi:four helix bundle protein